MSRIVNRFAVSLACIVSAVPVLAQSLTVGNYKLVSENRLTRTSSQFAYTADITNTGVAATGVTATVTSSLAAVVINQGQLNFGNVPANGTVTSTNTFTFTQDRTVQFDPAALHWTIQFNTTPQPPVASAGPNQSISLGALVTLNGSGSTDPGGHALTFLWSFVSKPAGSTAALSSATAVNPTFTADKVGTFVLSLVVNNGTLSSSPAQVTVSTGPVPPTANAGLSQTVTDGGTVTLNGSGSTDPGGHALTYLWSFVSKPAGSAATLSNPTAVMPTFVADRSGTYTVKLVVNNGTFDSTNNAQVAITSSDVAPTANAGPSQTVSVGSTVTLNGSNSTDVNGHALTFSWSFVNVPTGSIAALSNSTAVMPTFVADRVGTYVVQLIVNDGELSSAAATVTISTNDVAPTANPGTAQTVNVATIVHLSGSASTSASGLPLTYQWSLITVPAGSAAALSGATTVAPTFVADRVGSYVVQLTVNDGILSSTAANVTITSNDVAPTASAGPNQRVNVGTLVTLDGSGSTDLNGHALTYLWSFTAKPLTSTATLSGPTSVNPTFTVDVAGSYVIQLIVNDGFLNSAPVTVTVSTNTLQPTANAGPNQMVSVGASVQLDGTGSTDPNGLPLTFAWSLITRPTGSSAALNSSTAAKPTFTADRAGNYVAQLTVSDSLITGTTSTVTISTTSLAPVANPGSNQNATVGQTVTLNGSGSTSYSGYGLTYSWSFISRPAGSSATLLNPTSVSPSFTADAAGAYVVQLIVNDSVQNSAPATVQVNAAVTNTITIMGASSVLTYNSVTETLTLSNPAPAGGLSVTLSTSGTGAITIPTTVTVPAGSSGVNFTATGGTTAGGVTITAMASGYPNGTGFITVSNRALSVSVSNLIGTGRSLVGTVTLNDPAPTGGVTIGLSSDQPAIASVTPATVAIAAGTTTASFTVTGNTNGVANISASGPGYQTNTAAVTVTSTTINLPSNITVAPGQSVAFPVSLAAVAPTGGVTVTLTSSNTGIATITGSVFIPAGSTTPTTQPQITGVSLGTVTVSASGAGFAPDSRLANVSLTLTFSPTAITVNQGGTATVTLSLSAQAPTGGITVALSSDDATKATVPATISFAAGTSSQTFTVTGVATGSTVIRASGTGVGPTSANVTIGNAPAITLGNLTIGYNLQAGQSGSLAAAAPAGNLAVTLTSADTSRVLLSNSATGAGTGSITITVGAGSSYISTFYVQSLVASGSTSVTASAPGYASSNFSVASLPSGFLLSGGTFSTTSSSANTGVTVYAEALNVGTLTSYSNQALRGGYSVNVPVSTSDATVGIIANSPVTFNGGDSSQTASFHPVGGGTATITAGTPSGFSTPASGTTGTATVTAPGISFSNVTVGYNAEVSTAGYLGAAAPAGNTVITITSGDATKLLLATSATAAGSASITLTVAAGGTYTGAFYLQGLASSGSVTYMATAPGYTAQTNTVTFNPTGFLLSTSSGFGANFSTTSSSANTTIYTYFVNLTSALVYSGTTTFRPGAGPLNVNVTSSNTAVGTVTTSPVMFSGGEQYIATAFHPVGGGTTTLAVSTPTGYSTPTQYTSAVATVTAPAITLNAFGIGNNFQVTASGNLAAPAPAGNLAVTLTSSDSTKLLLSTSATAVGATSITVSVPAGSTYFSYYAQALTGTGTASVTASATGFTNGSATATFQPTGFILYTPTGFGANFTTTTFSANSTVYVYAALLTPTTLTYAGTGTLRAGISALNVSVTSANTTTGTVTTSPVIFNAGDTYQATAFHPLNAGTSVISVTQPSGFSTPAGYTSATATVTAPAITVNAATVGNNLETAASISLGAPAPTGGLVVTLTSGDATKLLISASATTVGSGALNVTIPAGYTYFTTSVYVQALAGAGTVTLTASAPGFAAGSSNVTLVPSGFILYTPAGYGANFSTTTLSASSTVYLFPATLDPTTLNYAGTGTVRPGASPSPGIASGTTSVGTISGSPVTFAGGDTSKTLQFQPAGTGSTILTVVQPSGFSSPSNYSTATATVSAPAISINAQTVGKDLQVASSVSLAAPAPTGGVTVTITSSDVSKVLLSTSQTGAGSGSVTLTVNAGSTSASQTLYIQGLAASGTATLNATASSYGSSSATVTLVPSGFVLYTPAGFGGNFSTTPLSADSTGYVYAVQLDPTTLNYAGTQQVRGGASVTVPLSSSNTGVITVPASVVFNAGDQYQLITFHPVANGTAVITAGVPSGFSTPSNYRTPTVTVAAPSISVGSPVVGQDLQVSNSVSLGVAAPSGGETITLTSADASRLLLSSSPTTAGAGTLSLTIPAGQYSATYYVQALAGSGTVNITASGSSFAAGAGTVTLYPSGFIIQPTTINATHGASSVTLTVFPALLDPTTLNFYTYGTIRAGLSGIAVPVTSADTTIGTITSSPLSFSGNQGSLQTAFTPVGVGSTVITVGTPASFSQPSNNRQATANVN